MYPNKVVNRLYKEAQSFIAPVYAKNSTLTIILNSSQKSDILFISKIGLHYDFW